MLYSKMQKMKVRHDLIGSLILAILIAFSGGVYAADTPTLILRKNNHTVKRLNVSEIMQSKRGIVSVTVDNPTDSKIHTYEGMSLTVLLEQVFGNDWKAFDAVKFTTLDGYQPVIPTASIIANFGVISTREKEHQGFSELRRKNGETVDPGPFFLVWENIKDPGAKEDSWLSWPWQITSIELTSFAREFPNSAPPDHSGNLAQKGFLDFRQHCIKCHTINGDGGNVGPELNYPVNVTEYWKDEWLTRFIADPQSVRANSKMIPFYRDVDNREKIIASIVAYLKVMKDKKISNSVQDKNK